MNWGRFLIALPALFNVLLVLPTTCLLGISAKIVTRPDESHYLAPNYRICRQQASFAYEVFSHTGVTPPCPPRCGHGLDRSAEHQNLKPLAK